MRVPNARLGFEGEKVWQRKPGGTKAANLEEITPRHTIAKRLIAAGRGEDLEHGVVRMEECCEA